MKARIYETPTRPIITYTTETRTDTAKARRMLESTKINIILLDREETSI